VGRGRDQGKEQVLVLPEEAAEGEEVQRTDLGCQRALREEADHGEELRHLGAVPVEDRVPQHVQGVPGRDSERGRGADVPGDGFPPPRAVPLHPDHQDRHHPGRHVQA